MIPPSATTFTLLEWLAITGMAQGVLILVYILLRARNWRQAFLPLLYFFNLTLAFVLQFALRLDDYETPLRFGLWLSRMMGPLLCYLLVLQIARRVEPPERRRFRVLLLGPVALGLALSASAAFDVCGGEGLLCARAFEWLLWLGSMAGALALLALWGQKNIFSDLKKARGGRERYWLVLALVAVNVAAVVAMLMHSSGVFPVDSADMLLTVLGIAFVYLASTMLFRVYPSPLPLAAAPRLRIRPLSDEDRLIAEQIRKLMERDKLYQEQTFSRADLARELKIPESAVSRVVNAAFGKSFPRLLNGFRVEDAKIMLRDPSIPIQSVAFESGFNSLASFNRVFREETGETPSSYRAGHVEEAGPG